MADMPDDTTPAEAIEAAADALSTDPRLRGFTMTGWQRTVATVAVEAAAPLIAARAAAGQLQRDIQLAAEYGARYVVYECPQSTRVGRVPVEYPFADLRRRPSWRVMTDAGERQRWAAALADAVEGLHEMIGYVPDYFRDKWDHQAYIDRAEKALADLLAAQDTPPTTTASSDGRHTT